MTLAATVLLSAVGVYIHTLWNIGGIITSLLFIGASTWLAVTPSTAENEVCGSRHIILVLRPDRVNRKHEPNMYPFFCNPIVNVF